MVNNSYIGIWLTIIFLLCFGVGMAQPHRIQHQDRLGDSLILRDISERPSFQKKPKARTFDLSGGFMLTNDGYGFLISGAKAFGYEDFGYGNEEKYYNSHLFQLELSERFHKKEYRDISYAGILNLLMPNNENYFIYGKVNNVYQIKLSYGQRRLFGGKGEPGSPLIQYFLAAGPSMGLIKPYYINTMGGATIKFDSTNYNNFLNKEAIIGRAPFGTGFKEAELNFGAHLKGGLHFDFAKNPKKVSAIDLGFSFDYYFNPILQMAESEERSFFAQLFISYQFGRRW